MEVEWDIIHDKTKHIQQRYTWDCGVACVQMALSCFTETPHDWNHLMDETLAKLRENPVSYFGKRPWTIDLCNILYHLQINFVFFTTVTHVNEELSPLHYYSKSISKDKTRVNSLFDMSYLKTCVKMRSLSTTDLIHLLNSGPLILLVNANKLGCVICSKKRKSILEKISCFRIKSSFIGHYILVVGYNSSGDIFSYRNPALSSEVCIVGAHDLEEARCCRGTDEDTVAVCLDGSNNVEPSPVTSQSQ